MKPFRRQYPQRLIQHPKCVDTSVNAWVLRFIEACLSQIAIAAIIYSSTFFPTISPLPGAAVFPWSTAMKISS